MSDTPDSRGPYRTAGAVPPAPPRFEPHCIRGPFECSACANHALEAAIGALTALTAAVTAVREAIATPVPPASDAEPPLPDAAGAKLAMVPLGCSEAITLADGDYALGPNGWYCWARPQLRWLPVANRPKLVDLLYATLERLRPKP